MNPGTRKRRAQQELNDTENRRQRSQELAALGRLAGGVAHEFNNILTAIAGHAGVMIDEAEPGHRWMDDLLAIRSSAERASRLTRQLLTFSRKRLVKPETVNLSSAIRQMTGTLETLVGEQIELELCLACDQKSVLVDLSQLQQVVMNLVLNACDAMPRGGRLKIATTVVDTELAPLNAICQREAAIALTVEDTGVGMDKRTRERLFEPFFTNKPQDEGGGFGLATVYGIVQQLGGNIHVKSKLGQGTTMTVYFPELAEQPAQLITSTRVSPSDAPSEGLVLIVDDEQGIVKIAKRILTRAGYQVVTAGGPLEALAIVNQHGPQIHVLLTDAVMPIMNGGELSERVCAVHPHITTVFMSGYAADQVTRHGVQVGTHAFIEKPFHPQQLEQEIKRAYANLPTALQTTAVHSVVPLESLRVRRSGS